jgi:SAM-dependent methyltransferase
MIGSLMARARVCARHLIRQLVFSRVGPFTLAMVQTDWEGRYRSGDMPWEKGEPSPGLLDFLAAHPELPRSSVLVPGCGTGHDVRAWACAGFSAIGLDLAPSAIQLAEERTRAAGLTAHYSQADFLVSEPFATFDYLFEHTLFCAINPSQRDAYTQAVLRWLRPGGQFLAIHYMLRDAAEPPHGCTQEELMERFLPHFDLIQGIVPRSYQNRTGLELLLWWRRKSA